MIKAFKSFLSIGLVIFSMVIFSSEARAEIEAPKITSLTTTEYVSLSGTAPENSQVLIYLDGNFIGQAEAKTSSEDATGINCSTSTMAAVGCLSSWHFQYKPTPKLGDGTHLVLVMSQDRASLVLSAPSQEIKFTVNVVPAPTLISPNKETATAELRPLIVGLTKSRTTVKIFIDGLFNGQTGILDNDSGTANFAYRPTVNLSRSFHKITARAEDGGGKSSPESEALDFKIEPPLPAPTIFKPVINQETSSSRPFIVGLAKNDSKIKIYIDKKYQGELIVKNHPSGTANFAYKPIVALIRGEHLVYTVAIDRRGKKSSWSNLVNFSTKNSAIAESVRDERKEATVNIKEPKEPVKNGLEPVVISDDSGTAVKKSDVASTAPTGKSVPEKPAASQQDLDDKGKESLENLRNIIGANSEISQDDRGMINEGKENQGRLKLGIIIFILFLIGVVVWLLWVNRELVKERRAQNEAEETARKNKNDEPG